MKLYREKEECTTYEIFERLGFTCANRDHPSPQHIWEKDGKQYEFTGWENTPNTALMAANPKYINIEEIN